MSRNQPERRTRSRGMDRSRTAQGVPATGTAASIRGVIESVTPDTTRAGNPWGTVHLRGLSAALVIYPRVWEQAQAWRQATPGTAVSAEGLLDARRPELAVIARTAAFTPAPAPARTDPGARQLAAEREAEAG